jgi:hypothetical protein
MESSVSLLLLQAFWVFSLLGSQSVFIQLDRK